MLTTLTFDSEASRRGRVKDIHGKSVVSAKRHRQPQPAYKRILLNSSNPSARAASSKAARALRAGATGGVGGWDAGGAPSNAKGALAPAEAGVLAATGAPGTGAATGVPAPGVAVAVPAGTEITPRQRGQATCLPACSSATAHI